MSDLMHSLEYVRVSLVFLLIITMGTFEDHFTCLEEVLKRLQKAKLRVNMCKYNFAQDKVDYL